VQVVGPLLSIYNRILLQVAHHICNANNYPKRFVYLVCISSNENALIVHNSILFGTVPFMLAE